MNKLHVFYPSTWTSTVVHISVPGCTGGNANQLIGDMGETITNELSICTYDEYMEPDACQNHDYTIPMCMYPCIIQNPP